MTADERSRRPAQARWTPAGPTAPDAAGRPIRNTLFNLVALLLVGVLVVVLVVLARLRHVPSVPYFPADSLPHGLAERYGKQLEALGEPPLPRGPDAGFQLRMLRMPAFEGASSVRYAFVDANGLRRHAVRQPGTGNAREVVLVRQAGLPVEARSDMVRLLADTGFWSMPSIEPETTAPRVKDGSQVLVEAYLDGRYHLVARISPEIEAPSRGLAPMAALLDEELGGQAAATVAAPDQNP
ncbi:hypothetical protein [Marilutibacter spongiae]|uniref:Uncharacterized protein n=1 Tax=Marilutibacter spongiae TaxID=2025720 RepID=A0A7W3TN01_9GAMM|nr:hypothetical protein [Lysobacter spongiae]MBB1061315.1 hypothetical protein [Lysobacter spongiae]